MKVDYGKLLMWSAVLVSMPRWAGAFISADVEHIPDLVSVGLNLLNIVAGFGMGFLEVVATAYMLEAWSKLKPRRTWNAKSLDHRWKVLTGFIIGLFVLMPVILAPYIVARMTGQSIEAVLINNSVRYLWSVAVVMSPAFIVGGVAFARDGMLESPEPAPSQPKSKKEPARSKKEPAPEPAEPAPERFECEDCQQTFGSVQAVNAHRRFCPARLPAPELNGKGNGRLS